MQEVVRVIEATLAQDDPKRLDAQHSLSLIYFEVGRHEIAINILENVVKICK